jgi:predicted AAA+ superfamily ATPase
MGGLSIDEVADTGLLHTLLDIRDERGLDNHPKVGASFEGFAMEQAIAAADAQHEECFHWATQQGAEIDLVIVRGRHRLGVEIKLTHAPSVTPSMRVAMSDLRLDRIIVVHAGADRFALADRIDAFPIDQLFSPSVRRLLRPSSRS